MASRSINSCIAVAVLAAVACGSCSSVCPTVPEPTAAVEQLVPGTYSLTMMATEGSQRGATASGRLTLIQLAEPHWGGSRLHGAVTIDLNKVGAPLLPGDDVPLPTSENPDAPGVLVASVGFDGYPNRAPVVLVGTVSNRNPLVGVTPEGRQISNLSLDGGGIGLWVHEVTTDGFTGRWSEWGIVRDGRGVFCAQPTQ